MMKFLTLFFLSLGLTLLSISSEAQCSVCTRTAEQLGEEPSRGLNAGIIYLAFTPLAIIGFVAYRWWKREKQVLRDENTG